MHIMVSMAVQWAIIRVFRGGLKYLQVLTICKELFTLNPENTQYPLYSCPQQLGLGYLQGSKFAEIQVSLEDFLGNHLSWERLHFLFL